MLDSQHLVCLTLLTSKLRSDFDEQSRLLCLPGAFLLAEPSVAPSWLGSWGLWWIVHAAPLHPAHGVLREAWLCPAGARQQDEALCNTLIFSHLSFLGNYIY